MKCEICDCEVPPNGCELQFCDHREGVPQGVQLPGTTVWHVWEAVCEEAEALVIRGEKFMLLDEEMTFRMGEAINNEILASIRNAGPATTQDEPWGVRPVKVDRNGRPRNCPVKEGS